MAATGINQQMSFTGKMVKSDGTNITDGTYNMQFNVYQDGTSTGIGSTLKWTEDYLVSGSTGMPSTGGVSLSSGTFQVNLGSICTLSGGTCGAKTNTGVDFNQDTLWLSIEIGNTSACTVTSATTSFHTACGGDGEMSPYIRLTAVPYSLNALSLGGLTSSGFIQNTASQQGSSNFNISGTGTAGTLKTGTLDGTGATLTLGSTVTTLQKAASAFTFDLTSASAATISFTNSGSGALTLALGTGDTFGVGASTGVSVTCSGGNFLQNQVTVGGIVTGGSCAAAGGGGVAGSDTQIQFNDAGVMGADADFVWNKTTNTFSLLGTDTGIVLNAITNEPGAAAAGTDRIYTKNIAGRIIPKWVGPSGVDTPFQANLGFNRVAMATPAGTSTTAPQVWGTTITQVGTVGNPALASTNLLTSVRRWTLTSATTAGSLDSSRQGALMSWRGNAAGLGGFFFTIRFGTSTLVSGNRAFVGMADVVTAPTNVDPTTSTTPGKIGMAINANTGNWNFVNNITGTAPTVTALGASFPVNNTSLYELVLYSPQNGSSIGWRVTNISTGAQTSGTASTNIPASTTFLAPLYWMTNNATAAAVVIDCAGWYLESDN